MGELFNSDFVVAPTFLLSVEYKIKRIFIDSSR